MKDVDERKKSGDLVLGRRAGGGPLVEQVPAGAVMHASPFEVQCPCGQRILVMVLGPATPAMVMPILCKPGETVEAALARVRAHLDAASREVGVMVLDAGDVT
jgi:hypothetical protein